LPLARSAHWRSAPPPLQWQLWQRRQFPGATARLQPPATAFPQWYTPFARQQREAEAEARTTGPEWWERPLRLPSFGRVAHAATNSSNLPLRPIDLPNAGFIDRDGNRRFDNWEFIPFDTPPEAVGMPTVASEVPSITRAMAVTMSFEGGGLVGNFDGQGLSMGNIHFNIGQGSLQPILMTMNNEHPDVLRSIFGNHYNELVRMLNMPNRSQQLDWTRGINSGNQIVEPWRSMFLELNYHPTFLNVQAPYVQNYISITKDCDDLAKGIYDIFVKWFDSDLFNKTEAECAEIAQKILYS